MDNNYASQSEKSRWDPSKEDIDPIAFFLERLQTLLMWIDEHRSSFETLRNSDPVNAEAELRYLKDATEQAVIYLQRLTELLLAGNTISDNKRIPQGLSTQVWQRLAQTLQLKHSAKTEIEREKGSSEGKKRGRD